MAANVAAIMEARKRKKKRDEEDEDGTPRAPRPESPVMVQPPAGPGPREILPFQGAVYKFYTWQPIQLFVAFLIVANFFINILEKEVDPYPPALQLYKPTWDGFADFFNSIFLLELLINFYGSFFVPFWKSGWNVFDFVVVAVGTISLCRVDMGPGNLLRLLRAFRVFRLFKRIKSLNKIIVSLGKAIPGVANAFLIMVIFMCIFAILGVEFFSQFGYDGTISTYQDHARRGLDWTNLTGLPEENGECTEVSEGGGCVVVGLITARGYTYGEEYYGTFFRALYTLFQVMTGESWSEAVARPTLFGSPLMESSGNPTLGAFVTGLFYVSFIIITQIIMVNVVVAVLLEKMVEDDPPPPEEEEGEGDAAKPESPGKMQQKYLETQIFNLRADVASIQEQLKLVLGALNVAPAPAGAPAPAAAYVDGIPRLDA